MGHWILVDYENVRPNDFSPDRQPDTDILVFLGASQNKIPADLVMALQAFGPRAHYVRCAANAKDALDFHIAFYLGEIASRHPDDQFHVISGDKGFDPLLRHLREERKIAATRESELPVIRAKEAPKKKVGTRGGRRASVEDVRKALAAAGSGRPRKVNTLRNWIDTRFNGKVSETELDRLIADMRSRKLIVVKGERVSYSL